MYYKLKVYFFFLYLHIYLYSEEAIAQTGMPTSKNSLEMENHVFLKAKSKVSI